MPHPFALVLITSSECVSSTVTQIRLFIWCSTWPSRPIRCDVWIVERMRYQPTNRPSNQPTNRPTDTASYRGALSHLKSTSQHTRKIFQPQMSLSIYLSASWNGLVNPCLCLTVCLSVRSSIFPQCVLDSARFTSPVRRHRCQIGLFRCDKAPL